MSNIWSRPRRYDLKRIRQEESEARKVAHDLLSTEEKISNLDDRLGPNIGATKERARLKLLLEKEYAAKESKSLAKEKAKADQDKPKKKATSKKAKKG
jgi:glucose-6-phosphate-specific signal transduction histidine kinase